MIQNIKRAAISMDYALPFKDFYARRYPILNITVMTDSFYKLLNTYKIVEFVFCAFFDNFSFMICCAFF